MGNPVTIAEDLGEQDRLTEVYGRLRLKLLDLSKKNRMLNYNLGSRSKRHLQIVDEVMDEIYKKLAGDDATLRIEPLDEPEDVPPEEKTEEFVGALEHALSRLCLAGETTSVSPDAIERPRALRLCEKTTKMLVDVRVGSNSEILARSRCFPLYPRKRTHVGHRAMSASCQKRHCRNSYRCRRQ